MRFGAAGALVWHRLLGASSFGISEGNGKTCDIQIYIYAYRERDRDAVYVFSYVFMFAGVQSKLVPA